MVGATLASEEITVWSRLPLMEKMRLPHNSADNIRIDRSAIVTSFFPPLHPCSDWSNLVFHLFTHALIGQTSLCTCRNRTCSEAATSDFSVRLHKPHGANFIARQNRRFVLREKASCGRGLRDRFSVVPPGQLLSVHTRQCPSRLHVYAACTKIDAQSHIPLSQNSRHHAGSMDTRTRCTQGKPGKHG